MKYMESKKFKIGDLKITTVVSLALTVFAGIFLAASMRYQYWAGYGPGAGFVPRWSSGIMLVLSLISLIQSFKQPGMKLSEIFPSKIATKNLAITWGALVFFVVFCKILGFVIATTLMLTALFSRGMSVKKSLVCSLVVAVLCFFLFKSVLMVQVPVNQFGW